MSGLNTRPVEQNRQTEFSGAETFRFLCHQGLACFNRCCRDINIFLSPYDVFRISRKLNLSSGDFLENYTLTIQSTVSGFPLVLIKMQPGTDLVCPFVTEAGCSVYTERPWACRMAPVEIRGEDRYGFVFDSSHCLGLLEDREWTVEQWMQNQGHAHYDTLEEGLAAIPRQLAFTGLSALDQHLRDLFFMVCYDLDKMRRFVFESSFLQVFAVPEEVARAIKDDDLQLMQWAIKWLAGGVDLRRTMAIRDEVFGVGGDRSSLK